LFVVHFVLKNIYWCVLQMQLVMCDSWVYCMFRSIRRICASPWR